MGRRAIGRRRWKNFVKVGAEEVLVEASSSPSEDETRREFLCVTTTLIQRETIPWDDGDPPMDPETARRGTDYYEFSDHVSSSSGYDSTWKSLEPVPTAAESGFSLLDAASKPDRPSIDFGEEKSSTRNLLTCEISSSRNTSKESEKLRSVSNPGTGKFLQRGPQLNKFGAMIKSKSLLESHLKAVHSTDQKDQKQRSQSLGKPNISSVKVIQRREKCRYCSKWYSVGDNGRGSCRDAPDRVNEVLKKITCYSAASGVVQRCSVPSLSSESARPFCNQTRRSSDASRPHAWRKRVGIAIAALICPCICCYVPLKKARSACLCSSNPGGRHAPLPTSGVETKQCESLPSGTSAYGTTTLRRNSSRNLISRLSF
ncbi:hypothetical protein L596_011293 [Steinernema carpocapsae]|uniref:Uncharacterized protein n=1 Tax=Steinernema carpocapsae TaxID=34508 RepID=A0A4U5NUC0_STECR|nr:hypothetical protein L596_011293 [Steinernema carpocapsae]